MTGNQTDKKLIEAEQEAKSLANALQQHQLNVEKMGRSDNIKTFKEITNTE